MEQQQQQPSNSNPLKRSRDSTEEEYHLPEVSEEPEVKRLRENLLEDDEIEFCTATEDLDLFMKSFQDEITASPAELGYLLEASDDELGLPPTSVVRVESDSAEFWEEPSFESFELDEFDETERFCDGVEYPALGGLFDETEMGFGSGGFSWMPETLPAQ